MIRRHLILESLYDRWLDAIRQHQPARAWVIEQRIEATEGVVRRRIGRGD